MNERLLTVLIKARRLIEKEENWTRDVSARDHEGNQVSSASSHAVRFCAIGAISRAGRQIGFDPFHHCVAIGIVEEAINNEGLGVFNDSHTHAEVLEVFDKAIKTQKGLNS